MASTDIKRSYVTTFLSIISQWSTVLVPVVALLALIPVAPLGVEGSKVVLSGILVVLAVLSYVVSGIVSKSFRLPHVSLLTGLALYSGAAVISTLFSQGGVFSFFGIGVEVWTVSYICVAILFTYMVAVHAQKADWRNMILTVTFVSAVIAVAFQFLRIASSVEFGAFSIFTDPVTNTVGRWSDLGIVALLVLFTSFALFAFSRNLSRKMQGVHIGVFVIATNVFFVVSPLVGLFLLAFGAWSMLNLFSFSSEKTRQLTRHILQAFIVIGITFFVFQGMIGRSPLFFQNTSIPTFSQTSGDIVYSDFPSTFLRDSFLVAKSVFVESPVFGVGASRFQEAWAEYKPRSINETAWWSIDFSVGAGLLLHFFVLFGTIGILGLAGLLYVVCQRLYQGLHSLDNTEKYLALITGLLWVYALFQTPSAGLLLVMLMLTGVIFSYARSTEHKVHVLKPSALLGVLVALVLILIPTYSVISRTLALTYAMQAEQLATQVTPDLLQAEEKLKRVTSLVPHEVYYQAIAGVQVRGLSTIASQINSNQSLSQTERTALAQTFDTKVAETITTYTRALESNPQNYTNHLRRAQFLSNLTSGREVNETLYATAVRDIQNAKALTPLNPTLNILEAQLALQKGDVGQAQALLLDAINKKSNYTEPALILAQLKIEERNLQDALVAVEYALRTNSNSSQALYIYGVLQFEAKNYFAAAQAFERLILVQGSISADTARLLADSYTQLGNVGGAKRAYEELLKLDPNNQEIKDILLKIQSGEADNAEN